VSILNGLKLVAAKQQRVTDPAELRRAKLVAKLDEQIALAKATQAGGQYTPTRAKRVKDSDGSVRQVQVPKSIKPWFWSAEGGRVCVAVRYGSRVLELAKGKTAVEAAPADVVQVLERLRAAVAGGELDAGIEAAAAGLRKGFKR
jgi:hypothetical protein